MWAKYKVSQVIKGVIIKKFIAEIFPSHILPIQKVFSKKNVDN